MLHVCQKIQFFCVLRWIHDWIINKWLKQTCVSWDWNTTFVGKCWFHLHKTHRNLTALPYSTEKTLSQHSDFHCRRDRPQLLLTRTAGCSFYCCFGPRLVSVNHSCRMSRQLARKKSQIYPRQLTWTLQFAVLGLWWIFCRPSGSKNLYLYRTEPRTFPQHHSQPNKLFCPAETDSPWHSLS